MTRKVFAIRFGEKDVEGTELQVVTSTCMMGCPFCRRLVSKGIRNILR